MSNVKQRKGSLEVGKILKEFQKSELTPNHRKGTFKIDAPFEEAVKSILKATLDRKKQKNPSSK